MGLKLQVALGSQRIMDARQQGRKPADLIIVSQVGRIDCVTNPVVQTKKDVSYDWRWAIGLDICFWTDTKNYDAKQIIDCHRAKPKSMNLWNYPTETGYIVWANPDPKTIDFSQDRWKWIVSRFPWTDRQSKEFAMGEFQWI